jgi:hypothetical protein
MEMERYEGSRYGFTTSSKFQENFRETHVNDERIVGWEKLKPFVKFEQVFFGHTTHSLSRRTPTGVGSSSKFV